MFHFTISALKSGRSSHLLDIIVSLIYPIISLQVRAKVVSNDSILGSYFFFKFSCWYELFLQDTSHKDLSALAKSAFRLLKWRVFPRPHLEVAVSLLLSSTSNPNWRTRLTSLTYIRTFMYRSVLFASTFAFSSFYIVTIYSFFTLFTWQAHIYPV